MNRQATTLKRLSWRLLRNMICISPRLRTLLFPQERLAERFGRGDAAYAWSVFSHHLRQLRAAGFESAERTLEIGPGRNIGTGLLWWIFNKSAGIGDPHVVLWDVYANAKLDGATTWATTAVELRKALQLEPTVAIISDEFLRLLDCVGDGSIQPSIEYRVQTLEKFVDAERARPFSLIHSHATLEHVWQIARFWHEVPSVTSAGGWHSHRIDLADHGYRDTNYIEMLEWSEPLYWATMRFIPGAINRWRASQHLDALVEGGFKICYALRQTHESLPIPLRRVAAPFRHFDTADLRTTVLDVVARKW